MMVFLLKNKCTNKGEKRRKSKITKPYLRIVNINVLIKFVTGYWSKMVNT